MKLRLRFEKGNEVRWLSHLDLARAWARAIVRADLPLLYSQGFNPHPKLSFSPAMPVGMAGRSEYVDVAFSEPVAVRDVVGRVNEVSPPGLQLCAGLVLPEGVKTRSLAGSITWADYMVTTPEVSIYQMRERLTSHDITYKNEDIKEPVPLLLGLDRNSDRTDASIRVPIGFKPFTLIKSADTDDRLQQTLGRIDRLELWVLADGRLVDPLTAVGNA